MTAPDWTTSAGAPRDSRGLGPGRLVWCAGWDRGERCKTPDPKEDSTPGRRGWRSSPLLDGRRWWTEAHAARRRAVRQLRAAGYEARKLWGREDNGWRKHGDALSPSWVYSDGPAAGLEAIDPWKRAAELHNCSARWSVLPRMLASGAPLALPVPSGCGQDHVCPVCAARHSRSLARQVRAAIAAREEGGGLALVTLTQRAIPGESLHSALERWRAAWRRMMRGRPGQRLRRLIRGYYYGIEVTRNEHANHWHLHGHVVLELRHRERRRGHCDECGALPGDRCLSMVEVKRGACACGAVRGGPCLHLRTGEPMVSRHAGREKIREPMSSVHHSRLWEDSGPLVVEATARRWVARAWEKATRAASGDDGWDPLSGCWAKDDEPASDARRRILAGDYSGSWWRSIDPEKPAEVYQACKYPTPVASLGAVPLAEFLAATHGRRWHEGGWGWRSIRKMGDEALADELAADPEAVDLGVSVGSLAPGHCPSLDSVLKDRGTSPTVLTPGLQMVQTADGLEYSGKARRGAELVGGLPGEECGDAVEWVLTVDAAPLAAQWVAEGWARPGFRDAVRLIPTHADDPDAQIQQLDHPSGRSEIRHVRRETRRHPTITVDASLAAALVRRTEAIVLGDPDPGDPCLPIVGPYQYAPIPAGQIRIPLRP